MRGIKSLRMIETAPSNRIEINVDRFRHHHGRLVDLADARRVMCGDDIVFDRFDFHRGIFAMSETFAKIAE
jgi:hypothetical protein